MATSRQEMVFQSPDRRRLVKFEDHKQGKLNFSYIHVLRVEVTCSPCAPKGVEHRQGTCFLVDMDDEYLYYLTAAHVIFCGTHEKNVTRLELHAGGKDIRRPLVGIVTSEGIDQEEKSWAEACPKYKTLVADPDGRKRQQYDYGVIALHKDDVAQKYCSDEMKFNVSPTCNESGHQCTVSGFPLYAPASYNIQGESVDMFQASGAISLDTTYRLWRYTIDTSGGQSGAPVFDDRRIVRGIHVGAWPRINPMSNYAVVLDRKRVEYAISGFTNQGKERLRPSKR